MKREENLRRGIKVSDDDLELLDERLWCDVKGYPAATYDYVRWYLHQRVMMRMGKEVPSHRSSFVIDHINRDPYDARRENLRIVSRRENQRNSEWHERDERFIHTDGDKFRVVIRSPKFDTEQEAVAWRDKLLDIAPYL